MNYSVIQVCINCIYTNLECYNYFHESVIKLPSQRMLKDYSHFVAAATAAVDRQLMEATDISSSSEFQKY